MSLSINVIIRTPIERPSLIDLTYPFVLDATAVSAQVIAPPHRGSVFSVMCVMRVCLCFKVCEWFAVVMCGLGWWLGKTILFGGKLRVRDYIYCDSQPNKNTKSRWFCVTVRAFRLCHGCPTYSLKRALFYWLEFVVLWVCVRVCASREPKQEWGCAHDRARAPNVYSRWLEFERARGEGWGWDFR